MRETILVASTLNASELMRSMALRRKNLFAFRVMSPSKLAETALIRCGKLPTQRRIQPDEQSFLLYRIMLDVSDFFAGISSLQDANNLTNAINGMRLRFEADEAGGLHRALPQGEFPDKNNALLDVYDRYIAKLQQDGLMDDIGLIRCALADAEALDAELVLLREFPPAPLEQALVSHLSGGRFRTVSLQELLGLPSSRDIRVDSLTEAYGAVNEVDQLIRDLYEGQQPLDRCVVAVTAPATYGQFFFELAAERGIPISLNIGVPIVNTLPAGLLALWARWCGAGFFGTDALQAMVFSDTFDRTQLMNLLNEGRNEDEGPVSQRQLIKMAGSLRLGLDPEVNRKRVEAWRETLSDSSEELKLADPLQRLGQELALPCSAFLKKYAFKRLDSVGGPLDQSALRTIVSILDLDRRFPGIAQMDDLIALALSQTVGTEQALPGHLAVTTIDGALSIQRDHLYVLGLSADLFPGKPAENALVLDNDWDLLPDPETAPTSRNRVKQARDRLTLLLHLAADLGNDVHLYWSGYDLAGLKELNPSSAVYDIHRQFPRLVPQTAGYFPAVYSDAYGAGRLYLDGREFTPAKQPEENTPCAVGNVGEREWSPSAIDTWFTCKRRFLYQYILRLDAEEADDPLVVIPPKEAGDLAHHLMEELAELRPDREAFSRMSADMFDAYLTARPPMDPFAAEREKQRFVRMMDAAWAHDPGRRTLLAEETMHSSHPAGLRLYGRPDRVEIDEDGSGIVVDFKTGSKVMQQPEDPSTCRQTLIYAWMLQQQGIPVSRCEYRYLRFSKDVPCSADAAMMGKLQEELTLFCRGLQQGDFAMETGYGEACVKDSCEHCPYSAVCALDKTPEEEEQQ